VLNGSEVGNIGTCVPLQIRVGADFSCLLTFTNPDGTPTDLTGSALAAQLWINGLLAGTFTVLSTVPTLGTAELSLPAAVSLALPPVPLFPNEITAPRWVLALRDASGEISSLLYGPVELFPAGPSFP
jgi:hypothetical protein